jgi:hypothetical protein
VLDLLVAVAHARVPLVLDVVVLIVAVPLLAGTAGQQGAQQQQAGGDEGGRLCAQLRRVALHHTRREGSHKARQRRGEQEGLRHTVISGVRK